MDSIQVNVNLNFQQLLETIKKLSPKEKLEINEAIWAQDMDIPQEHQDIVLNRIESARQDPSRLLNWDYAAQTLKP